MTVSTLTLRKKINNLIKKDKDVYTVQEIIDYFEEDGLFAIIFIVTFPMSIPSPPYGFGFETVFSGSISLLLAIQIILGFKKPILPDFIKKKKLDLSFLKRNNIYNQIDHYLIQLESVFKQRYSFVFQPLIIKLIALMIIPPAILMIIPVVFTNWFPSFCITLISFSYLFKDGLMMLISCFITFVICTLYFVFFKFIIKFAARFVKRKKIKTAIKSIESNKKIINSSKKKIKTAQKSIQKLL